MDELAPTLRALPRLARFVTEFGAQAVPADAAFMEPERWPDLDWDHLLEHHACQKLYFDRHTPPELFPTFEAWRAATQEYQAALLQLQVEDLRRLAHAPTGGFCQFCFADGHPSVTWSVLDHSRTPKLGFLALRDACRDVLPMLEPRQGLIHVGSQLRRPLPGAEITLSVDGHTRRWAGDVAADGVTFVGRADVHAEAVAVEVAVRHPEIGEVRNRYDRLLEWLRIVRGT
jgi:hypothetical protein